jgi:hypothetical protein
MSVNNMPSLFKYVAINMIDSSEHVFTDDTKGWDEITTSLIRGNYNGINSEQTAPISFAYEARDFFRDIFFTYGAFAKVNLVIYKRNEDWTYSEYTTFVCDFKTFKDDIDYVTLELKENSVRELVASKLDTEYDVSVFDTVYGDGWFVGLVNQLPFLATNTIQSNVGELNDFDSLSDSGRVKLWGKIKGRRTDSRQFSTHFTFTDNNGVPFDSTLFYTKKAISSQTIKYRINLTCKWKRATTGQPPGQYLTFLVRLIKDNNGNKTVLLNKDYSSWSSEYIGDETYEYTFIFNNDEEEMTLSNLVVGDGIYLEIYVDKGIEGSTYNPNVTECSNTYIEIVGEVNSDLGYRSSSFFTHEKGIESVLSKINPNIVLDYKLTNANYIPAMTSNRTIMELNLGTYTAQSKVRLSLKSLLDSLDLLYDIGVDITGNVMTIDYAENMYKDTESMSIDVSSVELMYNDKFCYNNIISGTDTSKDLNVKYGVYSPFNKKTYTISDNVISSDNNDLELLHPFKIDQYSIDQWWSDLSLNEEKVKDDTATEIAMIAFNLVPDEFYYFHPIRAEYINEGFTLTQEVLDYYNIPFTPRRLLDNKRKSLSTLFFGGDGVLQWASNSVALSNGFISKMEYESENVVEDEDVDFSNVERLYMPISCNVETSIDVDSLLLLKENKYDYVTMTDKRGKVYKAFISKLISNIGKTGTNSCELIIKEL